MIIWWWRNTQRKKVLIFILLWGCGASSLLAHKKEQTSSRCYYFFSPCFFFLLFLEVCFFAWHMCVITTRDKSYSSFFLSLSCQSSCGVQFLESILFDALYGFAPFCWWIIFCSNIFPNHSRLAPSIPDMEELDEEGHVRLGHVCVVWMVQSLLL